MTEYKAKELFKTAFNFAEVGEYESGDGFAIITKLPNGLQIKVLDEHYSEVIITQCGNVVFHVAENHHFQFEVLVFDYGEWIEVLNSELKNLSSK